MLGIFIFPVKIKAFMAKQWWAVLLLLLVTTVHVIVITVQAEPLPPAQAEPPSPSVARLWNEALLEAIRSDFARPTVHARNLFHTSIVAYDIWAVLDEEAETYFLGKTVADFHCPFDGFSPSSSSIEETRREAISYASYRLLTHRFRRSPGAGRSLAQFDSLMNALGYDPSFSGTDYSTGRPAALGNYLAKRLIDFGLQDGSNEQNDYAGTFYRPVNDPLAPALPGNPYISDPNRWQPLTLDVFMDQSGNVLPGATPDFVGAEWGRLPGFALEFSDLDINERDGNSYWVYHDPGPPPLLDIPGASESSASAAVGASATASQELYQWNFALVSAWSSHLDPSDGVMWDISPASMGNVGDLPSTPQEYYSFYNVAGPVRTAADASRGSEVANHALGPGHALNPHTGTPYEPQVVPRGDYTRVLAEFWADGPDSETPPGHWYTILNGVNDHPLLEKRFKGSGHLVDNLEWDVKAYFTLGGALHDAAIAAWGLKGWYDYVRPVSAIRYMAGLGQSSDPNLPSYHPAGIPLSDGTIELVREGDPLTEIYEGNIGKIKVRAWRGPNQVDDPETDRAGTGWILADNWWPYQRPTFVTPPFAGYVSGHSTFSRAAAVVLTLFTGDAYFPGGMGEFTAERNKFLVFEEGPSQDIILQWATYRDASDQTSLSRIWGGIHPPADDIPGRRIGERVGQDAFRKAEQYFRGEAADVENPQPLVHAYPNPLAGNSSLTIEFPRPVRDVRLELYNIVGQRLRTDRMETIDNHLTFDTAGLASGFYLLRLSGPGWEYTHKMTIVD